ncbi:DJ-1 family glyoxalase III [Vibrio ulleungensis]|uniref:DJ-1/PfpI family protein n=1 Tax=Vibrio ulleungensis TaxID=2807619 RepID=A0ABS2HKX0_9VIBR|nr:DJ-1 family glyoxalase III [Vibrio ulleungensis]MBM7036451.1 DJ-1/PfpI family protein [Vibrio ulleungensis]
MSKSILIPIAAGSEEIEAITLIDTLIRAQYKVTVASVDPEGELQVIGSRGIPLTAQCRLVDVADDEFDVIALPGGIGGAETFRDSTLLLEMVKQHHYDGKLLAAICASPALVFQHHQLFPNALMTCHPAFRDTISPSKWRDKRVTLDVNHKLLTSQGPGSALEFAIEIIIYLSGKAFAWSVAAPMVTLPNLNYQDLGKSRV